MLQKLKAINRCLRNWNSHIFGTVLRNVSIAKENLMTIQNIIAFNGITQERFDEEVVAETTVLDALHMQETLWLYQVWVKWLTEGDCNTAFFHAYACGRSWSSRIATHLDGDIVLSSLTDIGKFYQSLYYSFIHSL